MKLLIAAILLTTVMISCKKSNEKSGITYRMKTSNRSTEVSSSSSSTDGIAQRTNGTLTWTSGFANSTEIDFEAENNVSHVQYESEARKRIDLFTSVFTLGNISLPAGTYNEVEFKVQLVANGAEAALEMHGTYNGVPVVYRNYDALEIKSEKANVIITQNNGYNATIDLDMSRFSQGISSTTMAAASLTNGEIIISANSNASIYNILTANLLLMSNVEFED